MFSNRMKGVLKLRFKWIFIFVVSFLIIWRLFLLVSLPKSLIKKSRLIDTTVSELLSKNGINDTYLRQELYRKTKKKNVSFEHIYKEYTVPSKLSLKNFQAKLKFSLKNIGCELTRSQLDLGKDINTLGADISFKGYEIFSLKLIQKLPVKKISYKEPVLLKPHIPAYAAIVIDDWGYSLNNLEILSQIEKPLTIAVLPNLPYSERVAREANRRNLEVILHLPLEAHNKDIENEKDTIFTDMDKKEIIRSLERSIKSVPYIKGMSNHQGSKATEDPSLMKTIFEELKKRNLFFLDSFVTPNSVCEPLASSSGIRFAKRTIFLDNEEDAEYIKTHLKHLAYIAKRDGNAIGICHDKQISLLVLKELMEELEGEGIKFVKLSELVK
ncbi:MAG: divergent polysaccharide deacetylase family protein [Candidatus Omnitrophica bacterium]|nr:divergent polysaccharide deacetylase family protein [Candidatus Omnitrophota bacterium]